MSDQLYIWIVRWDDFQHYAPERDRAPAWIKAYTKQHDDDDYRDLSMHARGVLHDLRIAFARARGSLSADTRRLSDRVGQRITTATLTSLSEAGFIESCSRPDLEQRLEVFYTSRAPARSSEGEVEGEVEKEPVPVPVPEAKDPARDADDDIPFDPPAERNGAGAGTGDFKDLESLQLDPHAILGGLA